MRTIVLRILFFGLLGLMLGLFVLGTYLIPLSYHYASLEQDLAQTRLPILGLSEAAVLAAILGVFFALQALRSLRQQDLVGASVTKSLYRSGISCYFSFLFLSLLFSYFIVFKVPASLIGLNVFLGAVAALFVGTTICLIAGTLQRSQTFQEDNEGTV